MRQAEGTPVTVENTVDGGPASRNNAGEPVLPQVLFVEDSAGYVARRIHNQEEVRQLNNDLALRTASLEEE